MVKATPANDLPAFNEFEFQGETFQVRRRFKMFKFFKELTDNPVSAIALVLTEESLAKLEDRDLDMDEFKDLLEVISLAIAGTNAGN